MKETRFMLFLILHIIKAHEENLIHHPHLSWNSMQRNLEKTTRRKYGQRQDIFHRILVLLHWLLTDHFTRTVNAFVVFQPLIGSTATHLQ